MHVDLLKKTKFGRNRKNLSYSKEIFFPKFPWMLVSSGTSNTNQNSISPQVIHLLWYLSTLTLPWRVTPRHRSLYLHPPRVPVTNRNFRSFSRESH